ncbi:hypothetical protein B0A48_14571 [Cryoendolithus antarcticus]|uniref:Chitobiosyldiphosphodolichol beta-mannosyltransferase n=1 Tax=Cryoendolithus antarcticus TaxID=1507870 RepID=A0A1V8SLQ1_9PEZI|nr:hypothetical protein B0A48_14571 [Cryoendolithus antarcticus]
MDWLSILEIFLPIALVLSTALTVFIITLPEQYSNFKHRVVLDSDFTDPDHKDPGRSGHAYFQRHKDADGTLRCPTSVQIVVLGDIGRSPRMQYHASSIAGHGGKVSLVGYVDSDVHPDIQASKFIDVVPIARFPPALQTDNKILFLLLAPLKVLHQILSLYIALSYNAPASKWMLVQNPPSIPTLAVVQVICFFRKTKLVIDWHNFGYSILALRLGSTHPLVRLSHWYEGFFGRNATAHFAVSHAMCKVLLSKWNIRALPLHDRPPMQFQPLSALQRTYFLHKLPETSSHAADILAKKTRLLVSSTSWTADEDFSLLLGALVTYAKLSLAQPLPKISLIITGKGPQKAHYLAKIARLTNTNQLPNVTILTAWLTPSDYASLLGSADLGISLHTSSSGVDLPMKVVDMFGAGLPVAGWSKFEAWGELVREGENGRGFGSEEGLVKVLEELFGTGGEVELAKLKEGAVKEGEKRWEGEWMPVAGKLFGPT